MNKSKFLKKSLAMLLAVMLVVAMIPLSASAADAGYTPVKVTVVAGSATPGTVTGSGTSWNVEFNYTNSTPEISVQLGKTGYTMQRIMADGTEKAFTEATTGADVQVEVDSDDKPLPFRFYVVDPNGKKSDTYTVNWSVKSAAQDATVKAVKLDGISGTVDGNAINFTVPFGYTTLAPAVSKGLTFTFNGTGAQLAGGGNTATFAGTVGTNKVKAVPETFKVIAEDGIHEQNYTVTVSEINALTSIKIGDVEGVFGKNSDGTETGTITFDMPADTAKDASGKLTMVPTFEVGSPYTKATLATATTPAQIKNDQAYDFAYLLDTTAGLTMQLTRTIDGVDYTIDYTLKMVVDQSSTAISAFTASVLVSGSPFEEEGTVDGAQLKAEVSPKAANLNSVDLTITGPKGGQITIAGTTVDDTTTTDGTAANDGKYAFTGVNCTNSVSVKVIAANGVNQQYYTLTVTKAAASTAEPKITAAKLTVDPSLSTEASYNGTISGDTITFEVPYSTTKAQLATGTANYTYGKTNLTNLTTTIDPDPYKNGGTVVALSDTGDKVTYSIKFTRAAAKTDKSITNVAITAATNVNLVDYEEETYKVTTSGNKFKGNVSSKATGANYFMYYELGENAGSALYTVAATAGVPTGSASPAAVTAPYNATTGDSAVSPATVAAITANTVAYLVADETLAVALRDDPTLTFTQVKNNYAGHYQIFTFDLTTTSNNGDRLTSISAEEKAAVGTYDANKITLSVPFHFVGGDAFFLDYTVNPGAKLFAVHTTSSEVQLTSGGKKEWSAAQEKVINSAANQTSNPDFKIVDNGGTLELQVMTGASTYTKVDSLRVKPENGGTARDYTVKITAQKAETGAALTAVKVNGVAGTISGKTVNVALNFGTNLGALPLELTYSKYAQVQVGGVAYDPDETYNFTSDVKVTVTSEDGKITNVYTIKTSVSEQFKDITKNDWFYDYVIKAANAGIVKGKGDGNFGPQESIKRGDFAEMTVRMLGVDVSGYTTSPFEDVDDSKYYMKAIAYCADYEIIGGVGDNKFEPERPITRQEAAKVLYNALDLANTGSAEKFNDNAKIANWAVDFVYGCRIAGIFNGDTNGNFNPTANITRAETAKVMVDALKVK